MTRPDRTFIHSWQDAEENAAAWMRFWGYADAVRTAGGPDAGLDVVSRSAVAQVKWESVATGRPKLQNLIGSARRHDEHLFFTASSYTQAALDYASRENIALFVYEIDGTPVPKNAIARRISERDRTHTARQEPSPSTGSPSPTTGDPGSRAVAPAALATPPDQSKPHWVVRGYRRFRAAPPWKWLVVAAVFAAESVYGVVRIFAPEEGDTLGGNIATLLVCVAIAVGSGLAYATTRGASPRPTGTGSAPPTGATGHDASTTPEAEAPQSRSNGVGDAT